MRVAIIWGSKMFPASRQLEAVTASGFDRLYEIGVNSTIAAAVHGVRRRETVVLAGFYGLGRKRKDILDALTKLTEKGVPIERARDGQRYQAGCAEWVIDDFRAIAGERRVQSREEAKLRGSKGGRPRNDKPMSDAAMLRIWGRRKSTRERAEMIGLPLRAVYRWLKEIDARQNSDA